MGGVLFMVERDYNFAESAVLRRGRRLWLDAGYRGFGGHS